MEEKKSSKQEVLNTFLSVIFNKQIETKFPDLVKVLEDKTVKELYFKLWCSGVSAGLELNKAIQSIRETGDEWK